MRELEEEQGGLCRGRDIVGGEKRSGGAQGRPRRDRRGVQDSLWGRRGRRRQWRGRGWGQVERGTGQVGWEGVRSAVGQCSYCAGGGTQWLFALSLALSPFKVTFAPSPGVGAPRVLISGLEVAGELHVRTQHCSRLSGVIDDATSERRKSCGERLQWTLLMRFVPRMHQTRC